MLTNNEDYMLRVELEDFEGNRRYVSKLYIDYCNFLMVCILNYSNIANNIKYTK